MCEGCGGDWPVVLSFWDLRGCFCPDLQLFFGAHAAEALWCRALVANISCCCWPDTTGGNGGFQLHGCAVLCGSEPAMLVTLEKTSHALWYCMGSMAEGTDCTPVLDHSLLPGSPVMAPSYVLVMMHGSATPPWCLLFTHVWYVHTLHVTFACLCSLLHCCINMLGVAVTFI